MKRMISTSGSYEVRANIVDCAEEGARAAANDKQHCYCQNQDLGNLVALFMQSEVQDLQAGLLVSDERTVAVLGYTQEELVIVHPHKHSENGTLVGISDDIGSLLNWCQKSTQKYFNTIRVIRVCNLAYIEI